MTGRPPTTDDGTADRTADRIAIAEVLARYCHAVDHLDWDELASVYHEDATDRHGAYQGSAAGFLEWVKPQFTGRFAATMHTISNVLINLDGARAVSQCQVRADHLVKDELGGGIFQFWGSYVDVFEQRDGQWKILHRIVVRRFANVVPRSVSNGADFTLAPGGGYVEYSRCRDDPTYWDLTRIAAACAPGGTDEIPDRTDEIRDQTGASL
jgi:ketosteroid isomerase-like protein